MNTLYYGDNLDVLRRYVKDETVDLIYLDPPFKSNQDYNVLFKEESGERAAAQILAFEDTWHWDSAASAAYEEMVTKGGKVSQVMQAFYTFLGGNDMMAYLAMMAPRLVELRRVLKSTGSIYLHCDPTASHYLKLLMDAVFGPVNFRNEISWKRQTAHSDAKTKFCDVCDSILFFAKSPNARFFPQYGPHDPVYVKNFYRHDDDDGRGLYQLADMASPNPRPNMMYEWKGFHWPDKGWRYEKDTMKKLDGEGRIWYPRNSGGKSVHTRRPRLKRYLVEQEGSIVTNVWTDIIPLHHVSAERLGYPTQKPEALLERIIKASSNEGDVVLDPFCGCGTAVAVAQKLNRQWIGIDITHLAITLIKKRLKDQFDAQANATPPAPPKQSFGGEKTSGLPPKSSNLGGIEGGLIRDHSQPPLPPQMKTFGGEKTLNFSVIGEPVSLEDAQTLAEQDKYQFQWWALGLVDARPVEQKKGADQGIDGQRYFIDGKDRHTEQVIFSVKGGHVTASQIRDLVGVVTRTKAAVGVLLTMEPPTKPMRKEAADAGFYHSDWLDTKHPKIQILTIEELLSGKQIDLPRTAFMPASDATFKKAPKTRQKGKGNEEMDL